MKQNLSHDNDTGTYIAAGLTLLLAAAALGYGAHHIEDDGLREIAPRVYVKDAQSKNSAIISYITVRDFDRACMQERRVVGTKPQPQRACEIFPAPEPRWMAR